VGAKAALALQALRVLTPAQRAGLAGMWVTILALNGLGWGTFVLAILPHHFHYSGLGIGIGVAVTAWTLGARHGFDADHIAAIDNTTRKLMSEGQRPLSTGFAFALGHSSVVMLVAVGMTVAARSVFNAVVDPSTPFSSTAGVLGTALSGTFLYLIAAMNLVVLVGILKVFAKMRKGAYGERELEAQLQARGLMWRFFGPLMGSIRHARQLFLVGFVFGLGFDTATEVLLLAGTAAAATQGLPWYAVLTLPLLFAGGLTLSDSLDGFFMNFAYGWAFARPLRKVYYNIVITGLSIAVASIVATIEISGLLSTKLHLHGWLGDYLSNFNINTAGIIVAILFVIVWITAVLVWRFGITRWDAANSRAAE
jgi:high-affinity nickel-transport protein